MRVRPVCKEDGCTKPTFSRGWCAMHHARWKRHGDPNYAKLDMSGRPPAGMPERDRLLHHIRKLDSGCWEWQGSLDAKGYGRFQRGPGKSTLAHRGTYELLRGPIPDGLTLDHLCRYPACVNPDHLDPCTLEENLSRSPLVCANRTHCPQGHPYEGDNLVIEASTGRRRCLICTRETKARHKRKVRANA